MKNYAPENASFLLPFQFDPEKLNKDLSTCESFEFLANYVPRNYAGQKYLLPLRSIDGRMDFPVAAPNASEHYRNTPALEQCPYFQEVIDTFECPKEAVRLMRLPAGERVNPHTDHECGYEDGVFRVHIPILTNDDVIFTLNDQPIRMKPGEAWYTNVNLVHSVVNGGTTDRINLVIDGIRNGWSDALFKSLGYNFEQEHEVVNALSKETMQEVIAHLQQLNTPGAEAAIEDLKKRLNTP